MTPAGPHISVLIPSRGRPLDLQRCVESVLACSHPSFEVIVVEQGSPKTHLPEDPRLRHVVSTALGKSAALNEGISLANGSLFAFTDDDCTVSVDWLELGEAQLEQCPKAGLVFAALLAIDHNPAQVFVPEFRPSARAVLAGPSRAFERGGAGANMFARREVLAAISGFDALIGPGAKYQSCEEFDLFYRVLRAGFQVIRDPLNPVVHWGARPYADGSGQRLLRGYYFGEGVVLGKHVRCFDLRAAGLTARIGLQQAKLTALSVVRTRRPTGIGRGFHWLRGFVVGLCGRVDRQSRLFMS